MKNERKLSTPVRYRVTISLLLVAFLLANRALSVAIDGGMLGIYLSYLLFIWIGYITREVQRLRNQSKFHFGWLLS